MQENKKEISTIHKTHKKQKKKRQQENGQKQGNAKSGKKYIKTINSQKIIMKTCGPLELWFSGPLIFEETRTQLSHKRHLV